MSVSHVSDISGFVNRAKDLFDVLSHIRLGQVFCGETSWSSELLQKLWDLQGYSIHDKIRYRILPGCVIAESV